MNPGPATSAEATTPRSAIAPTILGCQNARRFSSGLRERHGDIRREIAVLGALGPLEVPVALLYRACAVLAELTGLRKGLKGSPERISHAIIEAHCHCLLGTHLPIRIAIPPPARRHSLAGGRASRRRAKSQGKERRRSSMRPVALLTLTILSPLISCTTTGDSGLITLVAGGESAADVFSSAPAPATLRVDAVTGAGTTLSTSTIATVSLPATTLDLGNQPETTATILTVTGLAGADAGSERVLFGASLPMYLGDLNGYNLNLFVQRTGEFARMSDAGVTDTRTAPTMAIVDGRYVFVGGGEAGDKTTQLFDLLGYTWTTSPPTLPVVPRSIVFDSLVAWLFDEGGAAYYDFSGGTASTSIALPSGGSSGDVAGGATLTDSSGVFYVVGATRSGAASSLVLKVDTGDTTQSGYPYGYPTWLTASTARLGAAAAWAASYGLVLVGGNTTSDGAGVEFFAQGATVGAPGAFSPDPTTGSGAAAIDASHVLLVGGVQGDGVTDAGVRVINLACVQGCAPTSCLASLPTPLVATQAFDIDALNATALGDDAAGNTHVYRIASSDAWTTCSATEIPTKVPHIKARAALSPPSTIVPGSFLLFGGGADGEIEAFVP